jgi:PAS domain S-box-containing protein
MAKKIKEKKTKRKKGKGTKEIKKDLENLKKYIEELTLFLPLPFCIVNPRHLIVGANQALKELTGYDEMETVGQDISFLFLDKEKVNDFKEEIFKTDKKVYRELVLVKKDGTRIPVSIIALARKSIDGDFQGYFLTISDISKTKEFQEELEKKVKEKTKELEEKIEELERFSKLTMGRELKMVELKNEIARLQQEIKMLKNNKN